MGSLIRQKYNTNDPANFLLTTDSATCHNCTMAWFTDDRPLDPSSNRQTRNTWNAGSCIEGGGDSECGAAHILGRCMECNKPDAVLRCSHCGAPYCSRECQRTAWKAHKAF